MASRNEIVVKREPSKSQSRSASPIKLPRNVYYLGRTIGKGEYGTVVRAKMLTKHHRMIDLACKIVDLNKTPQKYAKHFFERELKILSQINHPNIIETLSIIHQSNKIYIFMQYADNGDLLDYIKKNGSIDEDHAQRWFIEMLEAIDYLHSINIAHRDLKCENILISHTMNVKITDFGFARYTTSESYSRTFCGSAAYAAPEVIVNTPYNPKISDAWSLGVILFIMLNGTMPFKDDNPKRLIIDQQKKNYKYTNDVYWEISNKTRTIVDNLLEANPFVRWTVNQTLKFEKLF